MTEPTKEQLREWAERYDIPGSISDIRTMVDDARTLQLLNEAPGVADYGITVHTGADGVWVCFNARSGKSYCFQPSQQWGPKDPFRDAVEDWCRDRLSAPSPTPNLQQAVDAAYERAAKLCFEVSQHALGVREDRIAQGDLDIAKQWLIRSAIAYECENKIRALKGQPSK